MIMVYLAEWQEQKTALESSSVNKNIFEIYQLLWTQLNSKMEAFYVSMS